MLIILFAFLLLPEIIENRIKYKLNSLENCSTGSITISIPSRSIRVAEVSLNDFQAGPQYLINGNIKILKINGIHLFDLIKGKSIVMDEVIFRTPELQISAKKHDQFSQKVKSESSFTSIELKKVKVFRASITGQDSLGAISTINDLDVEVGPLEFKGDSVISTISEWKLSSGSIHHITADQLYKFSCHKMKGSSGSHSLIIDSLKIDPSFGEMEFSKKVPYQTDRFDLICDRLLLEGLAIKDNHIKTLQVLVPKLKVFRNKKIPRDPELKFRSLQYYLKNIPFAFEVETLLVSNGNVRYRELGEKSSEIGEVRFFKIAMEATRLSGQNSSADTLKIIANSGFMDTGKLNATFTFPYNQTSFECRGELKQMSLSEINRICEPAAGVVINSGTLYSMPFSFKATDEFSTGQLMLNYRNLDFTLQNEPSGESDNLFSKIKTKIASIFVKEDSKVTKEDVSMLGKICVERRTDRFIFNYMWKSIFSGIKSALAGAIKDIKPDPTKPC